MTIKVKILLVVAFAIVTLMVLGILGFALSMKSSSRRTKARLQDQEHECIDGGSARVEAAGPHGWMKFCELEAVKHGKWVVWEGGYLNIEGSYRHGKKQGPWHWYYAKGEVAKTIEYDNGVEVSREVFTDPTDKQ